ncbi:MAG TPA: delta-60 repeat domain-containing protein, partial [Methylomirabilota bacterium]|nr:delta-60 repeat domain-containing protein [Methylomirabilota bacterium]
EPRLRVARLTPSGLLDAAFVSDVITNGTVFGLAVQSDGKVVAVGDFQTSGGTNRVRIARLNADGTLDTGFDVGLGANATVYAIGLQSTGKAIVGGDFTSINGTTRNRYARLNTDGTLDTTFDPGQGANNSVLAIVVLPDDNVLIGGDFTLVTGVPRRGVARIRAVETVLSFASYGVAGGGVFSMSVATEVGKTYVLEATRNLISWTPIATNTATTSSWTFTDPDMAGTEVRFFRVREQ